MELVSPFITDLMKPISSSPQISWSSFPISTDLMKPVFHLHWSHGAHLPLHTANLRSHWAYSPEICTSRNLTARPVDLKAWPVTARKSELNLGPGPFRPVACPSPAWPDKSSFQGIFWNYSIQWWILLNTALFNEFVSYLLHYITLRHFICQLHLQWPMMHQQNWYVSDAPQVWHSIYENYIDQGWQKLIVFLVF